MLDIQPLPKRLFDKAKTAGVSQIELSFQGGSDEGYLTVSCYTPGVMADHSALESEIEAWAWDVYEYSGAGEGTDYGDDVTYDLDTMEVTVSEWYMARTDGESGAEELTVTEEVADDAV